MERCCSTGQSPQRAVAQTEEEEEEDEALGGSCSEREELMTTQNMLKSHRGRNTYTIWGIDGTVILKFVSDE